jgi:hypothetical protein
MICPLYAGSLKIPTSRYPIDSGYPDPSSKKKEARTPGDFEDARQLISEAAQFPREERRASFDERASTLAISLLARDSDEKTLSTVMNLRDKGNLNNVPAVTLAIALFEKRPFRESLTWSGDWIRQNPSYIASYALMDALLSARHHHEPSKSNLLKAADDSYALVPYGVIPGTQMSR